MLHFPHQHGRITRRKQNVPVYISITVQPTLQMSTFLPWPCCLITSGAIQYGVP